MKYGIFFSYGSDTIRLPINPEELPETHESANETVEVLGLGEVTQRRIPKQRTVSFSGLFPAFSTTDNESYFRKPEALIRFFTNALKKQRVIRYTPVRYMENGDAFLTGFTGFRCTVESFSFTERGGETGDFYFDLTIREYRAHGFSEMDLADDDDESVYYEASQSRDTGSEIVVGSVCTASGTVYATASKGGAAVAVNGLKCTVTRISSGMCHIVDMSGTDVGFISKSSLRLA